MNLRKIKIMLLISFTAIIALGMTACGGSKTVTMNLDETVTIEKYMEVTPENIMVSSKVYPPLCDNLSVGWEEKGNLKTYVTFIADVKNLTDDDLQLSDMWHGKITSGEKSYESLSSAVLKSDGTQLSALDSIGAGETKKVYLITEVDKSSLANDNLFELAFGKDKKGNPVYNHQMTIDTTKRFAVVGEVGMGDKITSDGVCSLTLKSLTFASKVEPEKPSGYYQYYKADSGKRFIVLKSTIKNLAEDKNDINDLYGITFVYKDGKEYIGSLLADDKNKANINENENLGSKKSRTTYGVANVDKDGKKSDYEIYFYVGGKYYQYTR